ncbi:Anionic trypsin-2 [Pseudolycoriella hygida]|uniref:Anionic trypsin-2 n=1 Tax=Pseudolycoriella hygida TaxID=35572 RepID=A0A9Q0N4V0_9DIPT|nr:Anionic trypsin-2 [Pseudolycoriella hygida]
MKYTLCVLLCSAFFVHNVYSLQGGTTVTLGTHPSHALVLVEQVPHGGTIVNINHVVTSCRIVLTANNELRPVAQFAIRAGGITFTEGTANTVTAIFPHPEFNPWTFNNDVAVANNFAFNFNVANPPIAPAVLNERVFGEQTDCFVVGFNAPTVAVPNPPLLQLVQPVLNRATGCNAATVHNGRVLESMLCGGVLGANSGICPSTIGGGLYCFGNFTGIATSGTGCGAANSPGIYTQVRHHVQWINNQLTRTQIPAAGPTHPPGVIVSAAVIATVAHTLLICLAFLITIQCLFNAIF